MSDKTDYRTLKPVKTNRHSAKFFVLKKKKGYKGIMTNELFIFSRKISIRVRKSGKVQLGGG